MAFSITRDERSEQTIRFSGTCGFPAERMEEVVVKDSAVEVRWRLLCVRDRRVRDFRGAYSDRWNHGLSLCIRGSVEETQEDREDEKD